MSSFSVFLCLRIKNKPFFLIYSYFNEYNIYIIQNTKNIKISALRYIFDMSLKIYILENIR